MSDFTAWFNRLGQVALAAHELHPRHLTGRNAARSGPALREQPGIRPILVLAQTGLDQALYQALDGLWILVRRHSAPVND
jgi:hypothetical protein